MTATGSANSQGDGSLRILVIGASGFIGGTIARKLTGEGHDIVRCGRGELVRCDFTRDTAADWLKRLDGIDAVINAAGIIRGDFETVHARGPSILFDACLTASIPTVIQISGLGMDSVPTRFLDTKARADDHLCHLAAGRTDLNWIVLRPSLVIGRGGQSTDLFAALAALPVPLGIGNGTARLQPIHVDDLARAVATLLRRVPQGPMRLDAVGPEVLTTGELTALFRSWLELKPIKPLPVPFSLLRLMGYLGDRCRLGSLTHESVAILQAGNTADITPFAQALGRTPGSIRAALRKTPALTADRVAARLFWLRAPLRLGLAAVWIVTATVSAFLYPLAGNQAMLSRLGLSGAWSYLAIYSGAALDSILGLLLLLRIRPVATGLAQMAVMLGYTVLATIALPSLWVQPFGPLLKNLPILLATLIMIILEAER